MLNKSSILNSLLAFVTPTSSSLHIQVDSNRFSDAVAEGRQYSRRSKNMVPVCQAKNSYNDVVVEPPPLPPSFNVKGVTLKMAFDKSYAVADNSEEKSERFTCPLSLDLVHKLRRCSDAVLVGRGTVERDNCTLTVRRVSLFRGQTDQPVRVVLDPQLKLLKTDESSGEYDYALLKDNYKTILYHTGGTTTKEPKSSSLLQIVNIAAPSDNSNQQRTKMDPRKIIQDLKSKGIQHVMVEGGPATAIAFLNEKVVDRAIFIRAPLDFIDPVPSHLSNEIMKSAGLELLRKETCGDDIVEFWSRVGLPWPTGNEGEPQEWPC